MVDGETQRQRAERIFRALDVDSSGYVDRGELSRHVMATAGVDQAMAERVFQAFDVDSSGNIELSEWLRQYEKAGPPQHAQPPAARAPTGPRQTRRVRGRVTSWPPPPP